MQRYVDVEAGDTIRVSWQGFVITLPISAPRTVDLDEFCYKWLNDDDFFYKWAATSPDDVAALTVMRALRKQRNAARS